MKIRSRIAAKIEFPFYQKKGWMIFVSILAVLFTIFWFLLPDPLFDTSYSTVLTDKNGTLMGAKIAEDEQWRFPVSDDVPKKFEVAITEFEDRNFRIHPGVDPIAIIRALKQNYESGEIVSGASTLSMQVIRLSRQNKDRTVPEKIREMLLALRLELSHSKDEILSLYAAHAPFGGNVVGLEAAAWRYFGRNPHQLSWAEMATLAVLPNSPALIHPGRNRASLKQKRDRLLKRLLETEALDSLTYELSLLEPLPEKPLDLPSMAPHVLAELYSGNSRGEKVQAALDIQLQQKINRVVERNYEKLAANGIHNAAVIVLDVKRAEIAAYVGNTISSGAEHDNQVNVASAPRSTGSILKPLLYMLKLNEGEMLPGKLVPDIPSQFSGYTPRNFTRTYDGAVPANEALVRSLNVPAVYMLQEFGVPKFHHYLREMGIGTVSKAPEHYGLSLILGGAEGKLTEITSAYATLAKILNDYKVRDEASKFFTPVDFHVVQKTSSQKRKKGFFLDPGAVWLTFEAMLEVNRPEGENFWKRFKNPRKVAWKTGTSFGNRDGWAVGITPEYVVGVWVGNADGEGRPALTGIRAAGPLLFDVFDVLPQTSWFSEPVYELEKIQVCRKSGHRAGAFCEETVEMKVPVSGLETEACPYHQRIHTDESGEWRVNSLCADISKMKVENRFILPPVMEWYYRKNNSSYKSLPPLKTGCGEEEIAAMKLVYPYQSSVIYVPVELDGDIGKTVFEVAHRKSDSRIFWHLDEAFIGETSHIHQMPLSPEPGNHTLTVVDEEGERLEYEFEVLK